MSIGIALSTDRIATATWSRALVPWQPAASWDDLREALAELRERTGVRAPRARIALLPPLAQARVLELPRLRASEYARVLSRDASRYFLIHGVPHVAAGLPVVPRGSPVRVLAAAAPRDLVEAVVRGVEESGWRLESIVPAEAAWLAAAGAGRRDRAAIVVTVGDLIEVLHVHAGRLVGLRRVPLALCAPEEMAAALAVEEIAVQRLDDPAASAAVGALDAAGPEVLPERCFAARRHRANAVAARLALAAALLAASAGLLDLWGLHRELAAVAGERAKISADVAAALLRRDTTERMVVQHAAVARLDAEAPRWSEVLADLSDYLPRDASLTAFRGRADSVGLEGVALQAAGVFDALRRAPRVLGLRADAPIRQEAQRPGEAPVERFAVTARLGATP